MSGPCRENVEMAKVIWQNHQDKLEARRQKKNQHAREYARAVYQERKRLGLCRKCGKEDAEPGKRRCAACILYDKQRRSETHRRTLHSSQLPKEGEAACTRCKRRKAVYGRKLCADCAAYMREYKQRTKNQKEN